MSHANAALTPRARLRVAQLVVDQGVPIAEVAARFQCSWPTVKRWADRYAAGEPMSDRSSRPHTMPAKTCPATTKRIVSLRLRKRLGPVQLAARVGVAPSTVHRVLIRCRLNRLAHVDRATGEPVRRYEHDHPGSMLHVDVKKLGNIPDGGGWRFVGRRQGAGTGPPPPASQGAATANRRWATRSCTPSSTTTPGSPTPRSTTTRPPPPPPPSFAARWPGSAARGVTIERVLSDNGSAYSSHLWRDTCAELGIKHSRTRPYRPQTNGKIERFHRTLSDGWGYARCYTSESERREALPAGSTPTTTTGPTPPAGTSHPSPA